MNRVIDRLSLEIPIEKGEFEIHRYQARQILFEDFIYRYAPGIQKGISQELVDNSFDSYRRLVLDGGSNSDGKTSLIFNVIISRTASAHIIEFKDNGTGFVNRPKNEPFKYVKEHDRVRKHGADGMIGGFGMGFKDYIQEIESGDERGMAGDVYVENLDPRGCCITIIWPIEPEVPLPINRKSCCVIA